MDINTKAKSKVLQDLIDMMDEKMVGDLKGKSPKFMKVETNDPEMAQDVVENALEEKHLPEENEDTFNSEPDKDADDEDLQKLLEMYHKIK